tara:strand:- start:20 stop:244 length:225 start_codon:yes stop_codon:yes gene_type:complete
MQDNITINLSPDEFNSAAAYDLKKMTLACHMASYAKSSVEVYTEDDELAYIIHRPEFYIERKIKMDRAVKSWKP